MIALIMQSLGISLISLLNLPLIGRTSRQLLERIFAYPRLVELTAVDKDITVESLTDPISLEKHCRITFGSPEKTPTTPIPVAGYDFVGVVIVPNARQFGTLQLEQDVMPYIHWDPSIFNPGAGCEKIDTNGQRYHDGFGPYEQVVVTKRGRCQIRADDSPNARLSEITQVDEQFRMFLVWRPAAFGGQVLLPIAKLDWWWQGQGGTVSPPGDCVDGANHFGLTSNPKAHGCTAGVATTQLPVLSPVAQTLLPVPC